MSIEEIKKDNYKIVGTRVTDGKDVRQSKTYSHYALIIGNEGSGVNPKYLEKSDKFIYIPMNDVVESLNVAVATSIILYEMDEVND